jgi:hypothetical protein
LQGFEDRMRADGRVMICRAIGQLQRLDSCTLRGHSPPSSGLTPPVSRSLLPVLSIKHLAIGTPSLAVMVMWTQLPPSKAASLQLRLLAEHPVQAVRFDVPSKIAANQAWLDVLLRHQVAANFHVTLGSDLGSLVPSLARYSQPLALTLQCHVAPEVLGAAVAGYAGSELALIISKPSSAAFSNDADVLEDMDRVKPELSDAHLKAILPGVTKLEGLSISDCCALSSGALAEVVERVGDQLTLLSMSGAANVTDCTLGKLLQNCRKLQKLALNGAPAVTEAGIALLLVHQRPGFYAELSGTSVDWGKLKEVVEQQGGCCRVKHKGNVLHVLNHPDRFFPGI